MEKQASQIAIQVPGAALLWVSLLLISAGLLLQSTGSLTVGLLFLSLLLLGRFLASRHLRSIEIVRSTPSRAFAGRSFSVEIRMENTSPFFTATDFILEDPVKSNPDPTRHNLPPGTGRNSRYAGRYPRRGRFQSATWQARSTWPFGLFEARQSGRFAVGSSPVKGTLVMPRPFLPRQLANHLDRENLSGRPLCEPVQDTSAEFRLLREFRSGDPVRAIHWPSSLRSGSLQVRQPEPPIPRPPRTAVLLHSFSPAGHLATPETFEKILRLVAGLLIRLRDTGTEVDLHLSKSRILCLRSPGHFERALEDLALWKRHPIKLPPKDWLDRESNASVYILSDCPREKWEADLLETCPRALCIDASSMTGRVHLATRTPVLRT